MSHDVWRRVLSVNLDGVFFTCREACKHMVERAKTGDLGGSIAVVASLAAIEGAARNEAYAATKGGVISMMKAIAVEHARWGVRANAILPGWIATDMTAPRPPPPSLSGSFPACRSAAGASPPTSAASPSTWPPTPPATTPAIAS
jgi:NAD(P)-dependent dehydrogenase (short-subunit alcohol dehydrogenase family)